MKVSALLTVLVLGLSTAAPAFAATPVYNSKANAPSIQTSSQSDSEGMAFNGRATNSKLGSIRSGTSSVNVMSATFRAECSKCSA